MARVLLIESEAPLVRLMSWFLIEAGYEVSSEDDVDAAAERVRAIHPAVIIVNTGMAASEREQRINSWRALSPESRVLDVLAATRLAQPVPDVGADASIRLPFYSDGFVELVADLVARNK